jgi:hypothetical protein
MTSEPDVTSGTAPAVSSTVVNSSPATSEPGVTSGSVPAVSSTVPSSSTTAAALDAPLTQRFATRALGRFDTVAERPGLVRMVSDDVVQTPPHVFVFGDGRARVVYPAGGGWTNNGVPIGDSTIEMATCIDASCSAVDVVELLALHPSQASYWFEAGFTSDGAPAFAWVGTNTAVDGYSEEYLNSNLALCDSVDCDHVTTTRLLPPSSWGEGKFTFDVTLDNPAFTTTPNGSVAFGYRLA